MLLPNIVFSLIFSLVVKLAYYVVTKIFYFYKNWYLNYDVVTKNDISTITLLSKMVPQLLRRYQNNISSKR